MPPLSSTESSSSSSIVGDTECCYCRPQAQQQQQIFAESTALLIVDAQEENWQDCFQKDFASFPERLRATLFHCRNNDAHIVWVMQDGDSPLRSKGNRRCKKRQVGSAQTLSLPKPQKGDLVVTKKGLSGTTNTRLISFLKSNDIDTVLVCGLWTSVSVQHTAFGIFEKGFRTMLVQDACADQNRARHEAAIALYGNYMYEMVHSSELEAATSWLPATPPRSFLSEKMALNKSLLRSDNAASVQNISFADDDNASEASSITTATASSSAPSSVSSDSMNNPPPAAGLSTMAVMATMMIATVMVATTTTSTNQRVVLSSR